MLVDGGSSDLSSVGTYRIEPFLLSQGVRKLEYVFVTHGDADHINGIQELLQNQKQGVEIDALVLPPEEYMDEVRAIFPHAIAGKDRMTTELDFPE